MHDKCNHCGESLVVGRNSVVEFWCPNCEDIEIKSEQDSLKEFRKEISNYYQKIIEYLPIYQKRSLLTTIYVTREGIAHNSSLDSAKFAAYTELMKIVTESKDDGYKVCDYKEEGFQILLRYAEGLNRAKKCLFLLQQGWLKILLLKEQDVPNYCYQYDISSLIEGSKISRNSNKLVSLLKFTAKFHVLSENFIQSIRQLKKMVAPH